MRQPAGGVQASSASRLPAARLSDDAAAMAGQPVSQWGGSGRTWPGSAGCRRGGSASGQCWPGWAARAARQVKPAGGFDFAGLRGVAVHVVGNKGQHQRMRKASPASRHSAELSMRTPTSSCTSRCTQASSVRPAPTKPASAIPPAENAASAPAAGRAPQRHRRGVSGRASRPQLGQTCHGRGRGRCRGGAGRAIAVAAVKLAQHAGARQQRRPVWWGLPASAARRLVSRQSAGSAPPTRRHNGAPSGSPGDASWSAPASPRAADADAQAGAGGRGIARTSSPG